MERYVPYANNITLTLHCALLLSRLLPTARRWVYPLYTAALVAACVLLNAYRQHFALSITLASAVLLSPLETSVRNPAARCAVCLLKCLSTVGLLLLFSLTASNIFTLAWDGFFYHPCKDLATNACILLLALLSNRILKRHPIAFGLNQLSLVYAATLGVTLLFFAYVPRHIGITDYRATAAFVLFSMALFVLLVVAAYYIHRLIMKNAQAELEARKARHDNEIRAENLRLQRTINVFKHINKRWLLMVRQYAYSQNWPALQEFLARQVEPLWETLTTGTEQIHRVQDDMLRPALEITAQEVANIKPYSLHLYIPQPVQYAPRFSGPVLSVFNILADNALAYLDAHPAGSLEINIYSEPDYTCIELANTLQPDFDAACLQRPPPLQLLPPGEVEHGLARMDSIIQATPGLTVKELVRDTPEGAPHQLSMQLVILG